MGGGDDCVLARARMVRLLRIRSPLLSRARRLLFGIKFHPFLNVSLDHAEAETRALRFLHRKRPAQRPRELLYTELGKTYRSPLMSNAMSTLHI